MIGKLCWRHLTNWGNSKARLEAGLSIDDLLHSLREQRQRYSREKYGDANNPGNKASA
jgi:hypothetical protein